MICPNCHRERCRRSKRRGIVDHLIGLIGLLPWRCRDCDKRFYAWAVPIPYAYYAHCRLCGSMELHRISSEHVNVPFAWMFRLFHVPAYRCAPCRHRFFSIRAHRRALPEHSESPTA